jgi:hypothetical protein
MFKPKSHSFSGSFLFTDPTRICFVVFFNKRAQRAYFIDIAGEYKPGFGKVKDLQDMLCSFMFQDPMIKFLLMSILICEFGMAKHQIMRLKHL